MQITTSSSHDQYRAHSSSAPYRSNCIALFKGIQIRRLIEGIAMVVLLYGSTLASAQEKIFSLIEPEARSQVWINPGFVSYHFDQNKNLNNGNWGAGAEYRFSTVASATIGRFYNSNREYSNYAGIYYQPIAIGPIKFGAVLGGFNGYPQTNNGGWFAAALPAFTWEGDRVGANVFIVPTIGDRVNGAISLQLKLKVFDGQ